MNNAEANRVRLYRRTFPEHAAQSDETVLTTIRRLDEDRVFSDAWIAQNYTRIRRVNYEDLIHSTF